jgi:hypothetical protein
MTKLEAYRRILKTIKECAEKVELSDIGIYNLEKLIKQEELQETFGITITNSHGNTWFTCGLYSSIGLFGSQHSRTISWSDDRRQPENEWLYQISFPTGVYIFGEGYCTSTFDTFFDELKSYNPKYLDTANHNLYFADDIAAKVHEELPNLLKKYRGMVKQEIEEKRIQILKDELRRLEGEIK